MEQGTSARPGKNPGRARLANRHLNSQDNDAQLLDDSSIIDDDDDSADGGYDGVPEVGMILKTHQEFSKFYKRYARRVGFGVSVRRSSFTKEGHCLYLELMCCKGGRKRPEPKFRKRTTATTNCQARSRIKLWGDGLLHLEFASLDHNHPVSPSMARFLNCYKHLTGFVKKAALKEQEKNLAAQLKELAQSAHIDRLGAVEELLFGESNCRSFVERGRLRLGDGDSETLRLFFTRMQVKNSNFLNVVDLDEEGCARNVFWADARSRAVYQYYSDVVMLDMMSISSKYDLPLACFVGVNYHGQPVLLGCALLSDETVETYIWLFKAWIAYMAGYTPHAGGYDPQTFGNGSVMPWTYQHLYQAGQQLKELPGAIAGQPGKKRKVSRRQKIGQSAENLNEQPDPAPSGLTPSGPAPPGLTPTGPSSSGRTPPGPTPSPPGTAPPGPTPTGQTAG